jgi:hypothetical protein
MSPCIISTACHSKESRRFWRSPKAEQIRRTLNIVGQHARQRRAQPRRIHYQG